jgi:ABC-type multidrug transport system fused ATPase/permease subunit
MEKFSIKDLALTFFQERKSYVIGYLLLTLAYPINNVAVPHMYGKLTQLIAEKGNLKNTFLETLATWILAAVAIKGISRIDNVVVPDFRSYMYTNIAQYIFYIHKENYESIQTGELISKMSKIPFLVLEVFYQIRTSYLPTIYTILFCLMYFFYIDARIGALVSIIMAVTLYTAYLSIVNCMDTCVMAEASSDMCNESLQDMLENILSVFTSDNLEEELQQFKNRDMKGQEHFKRCLSCASKYKFIFSILYLTSFLTISIFVYNLFLKDEIDFSQVSGVLLVLIYLLSQVDSSMQYMQDTISYIGGIVDVQNYIDSLNVKYNKSIQHINNLNKGVPVHDQEVDKIKGKISFNNIDLCFGEKCVLKNFNLVIQPKTKIAIIGKVGSGKSSLLKMLLKLTYPTAGQILIDDKNLPYDTTRKYTSYITQTPVLFNRSLYDNICYGTDKSKEDVMILLSKYKLDKVFGNHNLDSMVGRGGNNLSGGQKQIVMILRATLRGTPIILLDEPTTALDDNMKDTIMNLVFDIFKECTVIMITHDDSLTGKFDRVIKLG